jgi:hypothetical protein
MVSFSSSTPNRAGERSTQSRARRCVVERCVSEMRTVSRMRTEQSQISKYRSRRKTHGKLSPSLRHPDDDRDRQTTPEVERHPRLAMDDMAATRAQCLRGTGNAASVKGKTIAPCALLRRAVYLEVCGQETEAANVSTLGTLDIAADHELHLAGAEALLQDRTTPKMTWISVEDCLTKYLTFRSLSCMKVYLGKLADIHLLSLLIDHDIVTLFDMSRTSSANKGCVATCSS